MAPSHFWATWTEIPSGRYVEGDKPAATQPMDTHPPIVELTSFEGKGDEVIEQMLELVGTVLPKALGLAEGNVFVTYREVSSGRVYTGGEVVKTESYQRRAFTTDSTD